MNSSWANTLLAGIAWASLSACVSPVAWSQSGSLTQRQPAPRTTSSYRPAQPVDSQTNTSRIPPRNLPPTTANNSLRENSTYRPVQTAGQSANTRENPAIIRGQSDLRPSTDGQSNRAMSVGSQPTESTPEPEHESSHGDSLEPTASPVHPEPGSASRPERQPAELPVQPATHSVDLTSAEAVNPAAHEHSHDHASNHDEISAAADKFDDLPEKKESWLPLSRKPESTATKSPGSSSMSFITMFSSLALVIGIFLTVVWLMKRGMPKQLRALPTEVVERLGTTTLGNKDQVHLVRLGNKLLLITSGGPNGPTTLAEITDPAEVDRLAGICEQNSPGSVSETFRSILSQVGREPITAGFLDSDSNTRDEFHSYSGDRRA